MKWKKKVQTFNSDVYIERRIQTLKNARCVYGTQKIMRTFSNTFLTK